MLKEASLAPAPTRSAGTFVKRQALRMDIAPMRAIANVALNPPPAPTRGARTFVEGKAFQADNAMIRAGVIVTILTPKMAFVRARLRIRS